ncbi:DNA ligase D [Gramella sp. KN1008]|uniref:DNA ligase D n=1 Tax=Gramella sp. KN1008 TaxID=2529298 RepID=UPI00103F90EA|nr:DNA ligase D [Gramella sp. KN1008]TBW30301.1 DNA ligase D [Gramella sp. KN1008]
MALDDYKRKRDFDNTPEPSAEVSDENKGRFVVQRHQARRLHYDLRLEMEGVLKSWAVPKGPSMNPKDKRLAVQTEDHPVKYLSFQGTIPKGNYGAGEMSIWDEGTFISAGEGEDLIDQFKDGNLKLEFFGKKLKGIFALVRTRREDEKNHWLLIKKEDSFSTELDYDAEVFVTEAPAKRPKVRKLEPGQPVKPMLATAHKNIFNKPGWLYELKWDGYRLIANIRDGKVSIYSRNGIVYNSKFPNLVKDLENISNDVILDGELVVLDKNGIPLFQELQNYDSTTKGSLRFYVFDMLYLNGHSMLELPLLERKSLIPEVLEETVLSVYCDHVEGMGTAFYEKAVEAGMEGVIAKKADSVYTPGYRSEKWLKIKAHESQEALICGYTDSESSAFGSLILGIYDNGNLNYVGNCGTGFSASEKRALLKKMEKFKLGKSPFPKAVNLKGRKPNWIQPYLICEVIFSEWTQSGRMRHPVYKGLREDKTSPEIEKETTTYKKTKNSNAIEVDGRLVNFTNLDKVYWPDSGLRKYDLIDYYIKISEYILPYLKDRPQNLHRHPNGIKKEGFYQKDNEGLLENWIATTKIYSKSAGRNIEYLLCQDEPTLLYMANLGCIEINPWNSRVQELDKPDYVVIDLDPSEKNTFDEVIEVARVTKEILDSAGIKAYCKTTGSRGIHIYLPMGALYTYDEARDFTKLICYFIRERTAGLTSMERIVKNRKAKIYLDYLQNRRGQTLAAAYCVRPKEGAPVSAPIEWNELKKGLQLSDFNITNMPARLEKKGDLFKGLLSESIDMEKAIEKLEEL